MNTTQDILTQWAGRIEMRDGCRILRNRPAGWCVRSFDNLWLLARGDHPRELSWDVDRYTTFGTLDAALDAWQALYERNNTLWKNI